MKRDKKIISYIQRSQKERSKVAWDAVLYGLLIILAIRGGIEFQNSLRDYIGANSQLSNDFINVAVFSIYAFVIFTIGFCLYLIGYLLSNFKEIKKSK